MGLGTLCLSMVPIEGGCLPICEGSCGGVIERRRGEFTRHGHEIAPACSSGGAGNPSDMPQDRLNLLPGAAGDLSAKSLNGCRVPLSSPAASHKVRLVRYD